MRDGCNLRPEILQMSDDKLCLRLRRWPSQSSVEERLATLTEFIRYWYGVPPSERVDVPLTLPDFLPVPLKWLYHTTANHDQAALQSELGGWMQRSVFIEFHTLKHPWHIEVDESGFIEFVNENQGVYQCATTNNRSDDPSVFSRDFGEQRWGHHMSRLSDYLLKLLVFELTYSAPNQAWGGCFRRVFSKNSPLVSFTLTSGMRPGQSTIRCQSIMDLILPFVVASIPTVRTSSNLPHERPRC